MTTEIMAQRTNSRGEQKTALIVGGGLIGFSFARRFSTAGWHVHVFDVREELAAAVHDEFGGAADFFTDLPAAAAGVDFVQEAGPEKLKFKRDVFFRLAELTDSAVLATTTSAILPSRIAAGNPAAARIIVGHPFNPPMIMPVLEVVPGPDTSRDTVDRALAVYRELGFEPSALKKEIPGFVGNRLQKVLMWEAISLVQAGVIDVVELDRIVKNSIGLRYAAAGLFEANRLGGGVGGIKPFMDNIAGVWEETLPAGTPDMSDLAEVYRQVDEAYGTSAESFRALTARRDTLMKGFIEVRARAAHSAE